MNNLIAVVNEFKKEIDLILACSVTKPSLEQKVRIRKALFQTLNWEFIYNFSIANGVFPLLFHNLFPGFKEEIPRDFFAKLKQVCLVNTVRCLKISYEHKKIVELFDAHGIDAVTFKGPTLAELHYGDENLRTYDDIDYLIRKQDLGKVYKLLTANHYELKENVTIKNINTYQKFENSINFVSPEHNVLVEIHWDLMGIYLRKKITYSTLKNKQLVLSKSGQSFLQFNNEDYLLYLFLHGCKHSWLSLDMICSASQFIRSKQEVLDWLLIRRKAKQYRVCRMLDIGIFLVHYLLRAPVPEKELKSVISNDVVRDICRDIYRTLFNKKRNPPASVDSHRYTLFHAKAREKNIDSVTYFFKLFFHPSSKEITSSEIPECLHSLYYLKRGMRLISEMAVNCLRGSNK